MLRDLVEKNGGIHFDLPFALAYTGLEDTLLRKYIADSASLYEGKAANLPVYPIGSTIGTHVGPGAIAVAFFSNN
jgi:fatty acid-binding protein DegV